MQRKQPKENIATLISDKIEKNITRRSSLYVDEKFNLLRRHQF